MTDKRILIVDDYPEMHDIITTLIGKKYLISSATNAEEALDYLSDNTFELVLLDYNMPGADGIYVLKIIKQIYPATEVIMMSSQETTEVVKTAFELGVFEYFVKPFNIYKFEAAVELAVEKAVYRKLLNESNTSAFRNIAEVKKQCHIKDDEEPAGDQC